MAARATGLAPRIGRGAPHRGFDHGAQPATTTGDRTAWSGEIMLDSWSHVAIVNDPASSTTTMYVAGAPVVQALGARTSAPVGVAFALAAAPVPGARSRGAGRQAGVRPTSRRKVFRNR